MEFIWINHQIGLLISLVVILFITLSNVKIMRKLNSYPISRSFPRVSVLIPARNEEDNIADCVRSLLKQDYPNFEVIVLDDNSTDRTWDILRELSENEPLLRVFKGDLLPEGWFGKGWACHQLSKRASGEVLLFTDADTRHRPNSLRDGVSALMAEQADLVTAFPYEETVSLGERFTVILFPWFILCFLPLIVAYRTNSPAFSAAIGQYMLIRRQAYEMIGGHASIRKELVDDVAIARKIKEHKMKWRIMLGQEQLSCRMYHSFLDAYRGFTKNLFAGFGYRVLPYIFVWTCIGVAFLEPVIVFLLSLLNPGWSKLTLSLSGCQILISSAIWLISNWRFRFPLYIALLYPINVLILLSIAFGSLILTITGKSSWKGRGLPKPVLRLW